MIRAELHPYAPCAFIRQLEASIDTAPDRLNICYQLQADLRRLRIPAAREAARRDNLWQHSCFEAFVLPGAGPAYLEYNFSPSGDWACYAFSDYRQRLADEPQLEPPAIRTRLSPDQLELRVTIPLSHQACRIGLCAVIEDQQGTLHYWALSHPAAQPDFHHADAFMLGLK